MNQDEISFMLSYIAKEGRGTNHAQTATMIIATASAHEGGWGCALIDAHSNDLGRIIVWFPSAGMVVSVGVW